MSSILKGSGAEIQVTSVFDIKVGEDYTRTTFKARVTNIGKNYFQKGGEKSIDIRLLYDADTGNYRVTHKALAEDGSDGALILKNADAEGWITFTVDNLERVRVPLNGEEVKIENNNYDYAYAIINLIKEPPSLGYIHGKYLFSTSIQMDGTPPLAKSSKGFTVGDALHIDDMAAGNVEEIDPVKTYTLEIAETGGIEYRGKFKKDIKGFFSEVTIGDVKAEFAVLETAFVEGRPPFTVNGSPPFPRLMNTDGSPSPYITPINNAIYKVETDEELSGLTTYWKYNSLKKNFEEVSELGFPSTDDGINKLQYVYNGAFTAFAGEGILPFILEIKDDEIILSSFLVKTQVDYDITKPSEFNTDPETIILDKDVPKDLCRTVSNSPSVIFFNSGRWWFAASKNDPDRIWVSKPVKSRDEKVLDFSTYKYFLTVTPNYEPFRARNILGQSHLAASDSGTIGKVNDALFLETKGTDVSFGIIKPSIMGTPYFKDGAEVLSINNNGIILSVGSVPVEGEYTEEEAALCRNNAALLTSFARMKIPIFAGVALVNVDCDGFEIYSLEGSFEAGVTCGYSVSASIAVPYTGWGAAAERAAAIASASGYVIAKAAGNPPLAIIAAIGVTSVLTAASLTTKSVLKRMLDKVKLNLTDGKTAEAKDADYGAGLDVRSDNIVAKAEFFLSKYKLYEDKQPFLLRTWKIDEKQYSTVECGFTFTMSSDEKESVNIINSIRSFFISTDSSERIMPNTVNGETQAAQVTSFFGSEKLQAAKAADSLYYLQKGGQRIMRAYYQPNVPVPTIADLQKYNREVLRNRTVTSMKSTKTLPVQVWNILKKTDTEKGSAAVITDASGGGACAWSRITTSAQKFELSSQKNMYDDNAVIYDKRENKIYKLQDAVDPGIDKYIGYLYLSKIRTLPLPKQDLTPSRIARGRIRFLESVLPFIKGYPTGTVDKIVSASSERYIDGITNIPIPGNIEDDAAFEIFTDEPVPLSLICYYSEDS